ncbi:alpha/beta hydrolase [Sagittula sp. SSi028]|uniref:alpha/beta hydrolase n=1 Tax=Sagittula sp. SSi028 TaxID=3400636 RepID=UPI003AF4B8BC
MTRRFDPARLSGGIDSYLAGVEAAVPDIRPGVAKRVIWHDAPETRAPWAVVYVHGFSASSEELRPLPDLVAGGLGANLVFTRLQGHGRTGPAMAEATLSGWRDDVAEALAIGQRVGEQVLVMGCSTGCPLLTLALAEQQVAGAVMISPNYGLRDRKARLLNWPLARYWLPLAAGRTRGFTPRNDAHARYWTTRYPTQAVLPMAQAVQASRRIDHSRIKTPVLFAFDDRDRLIDHVETRIVAQKWGAAARVLPVVTQQGDDPDHHVIAGDAMSPSRTHGLAREILQWVAGLPH